MTPDGLLGFINQNNGLHPFNSPAPANGNVTGDPLFTAPLDLGLSISPWRVQPRFRPTAIVGISLPDNAIGDYRIGGGSPAVVALAGLKPVRAKTRANNNRLTKSGAKGL